MIKLIIFDLDGVLIDSKTTHYEILNKSISIIAGKEYQISELEHISTYDGLKTKQKLELLTNNKNLNPKLHKSIWELKQKLTLEEFLKLKPKQELINLLKNLQNKGYKLGCCSNSVRKSVYTTLSKIGLIEFFDIILSNEDVNNPKPYPEIYWKAMSLCDVLPEETLIIEDSPNGLLSAHRSSANVLRVSSPEELSLKIINNKINSLNIEPKKPKWDGNELNILIPMAGMGSRFQQAGYDYPKPLINVIDKPMIQIVVDNLNIMGNFIFVVQKEHRIKYNLDILLNIISPKCKILEVETLTEGAACTTLLAKELINNNNPLIIANSDQFVEWDSNKFMYKMIEQNLDGGIVSFNSKDPKWSFTKIDDYGYVTEVAEKNPISDIATVGIYYWSKGSDYVKYAEQMINNNIRVNNEFYICPVFNEAIKDNKRIKTFDVENMWGLGTPEDLEFFLKKKYFFSDGKFS